MGGSMKRTIIAVFVLTVAAGAAWADLSQFKVFPNPVRPHLGQNSVTFSGMNGGEISVYNANGRLVFETQVPEGATTFLWTLTNSEGERIASGIYLYRVASGGDERTGKIGVIR